MATLGEVLNGWRALGGPRSDYEAAEMSLVLADGVDPDAVRASLQAQLADEPFELSPAFEGALADGRGRRFWIMKLPQLSAEGAEEFAFEFARMLHAELELASARPILVDSLVGAAAATDRQSLSAIAGFCNTTDPGPQELGWAPYGLGVQQAWTSTRGAGVTIASIDTGVSNHVELNGIISPKPQLNLVEHDADASDRFSNNVWLPNPGHGTLVASVSTSRGGLTGAGGTTGPGRITGTAPEAMLLPIRAIRSVVDLRQSRLPRAFEHVLAQDCDVVVMCLGGPVPIEPVEYGLRALAEKGVVTVCAAGNCYGPVVHPAAFAAMDLVTAVAAVDYAYQPWEKTSRGPQVVVSAFGEAVWGASKHAAGSPDDNIHASQGTTLATSLTAGVAALWVARHGRGTLQDAADTAGTTVQRMFNSLLQATAYRPSGWPPGMGAGLVNAAALLAAPLPTTIEAPPRIAAAEVDFSPLRPAVAAVARELDPLAEAEAAGLSEAAAAEGLWRLYVASAQRRLEAAGASADLARRAATVGPPGTTGLLDQELAVRPRLAALM